MLILGRASQVPSRQATFSRDLPRVDKQINQGLFTEMEALMDHLPRVHPMDLHNPNVLIKIMKRLNPDWHCIYAANDTCWMRTKKITKAADFLNFKEGIDFFRTADAALAYIHGQLNAYGYSVDGMMKSMNSMWPQNEAREKVKLAMEKAVRKRNNDKEKKKRIIWLDSVKHSKRKDNKIVVDEIVEDSHNEKEEDAKVEKDEENMKKKNKENRKEEEEEVVSSTEKATATMATVKKIPILARAPESTSREATFRRDLPRVDELIEWGCI